MVEGEPVLYFLLSRLPVTTPPLKYMRSKASAVLGSSFFFGKFQKFFARKWEPQNML